MNRNIGALKRQKKESKHSHTNTHKKLPSVLAFLFSLSSALGQGGSYAVGSILSSLLKITRGLRA